MAQKMDDLLAVVEDFEREVHDDYIGLWEVARAIAEKNEKAASTEIKEKSLMVVRLMLEHGFQAGTLASKGGFKAWPNQAVSEVMGRVKTEWDALGHTPSIGDIVYFDRTK